MTAPRLRVVDAAVRTRAIPFRLPFHVAGVVIAALDQAVVDVTVELADGRRGTGRAAETMPAIWFDKEAPPDLTLRRLHDSLHRAVAARRVAPPDSAFALFAGDYADVAAWCAATGAPATVGQFGTAVVDRAIIDALCRAIGAPFHAAVAAGALGLDARLTPDLAGARFQWPAPAASIAVRHTVGGADPLRDTDIAAPLNDGLPESLAAVIATYGCRYFKIKVGPDSLPRLRAVAALLDELPDYAVTLDGNESFAGAGDLAAFAAAVLTDTYLARFTTRILHLEQPIGRARWRDEPVHDIPFPCLIDETDGTLDDFPAALRLGYRGVSAKTCKGVYKALLNFQRCRRTPGAFMSAEDLNHPCGHSLQQDLALAATLGLTHCERNGHHYMRGFADAAEERSELARQGAIYRRLGDLWTLAIHGGDLALAGLAQPGLG